MTHHQRDSVQLLSRCLLAMLFAAALLAAVLTTFVAPLDEPFQDWSHYIERWFEAFPYVFGTNSLLVVVVFLVISLVPDDRTRALVRSFPGVLRVWWISAVVLAWCVLRFIAEANIHFGFSFHQAPEHLGWITDVSVAATGYIGGASMIIIVCVASHHGIKREALLNRLHDEQHCFHCSYPLRGLPAGCVCPECGTEQSRRFEVG